MTRQASTIRMLAGALLVFSFATTALNAGSRAAYLPLVGPPPLRFEVVMARSFAFPPAKAELAKPADDAVKTNLAETISEIVPPVSTQATETNGAAKPEPPAQTSSIGEPVAPAVVHASAPASDMLLITPQMIAELLRPVPGSTNGLGTSIVLPFPINFTPPMEKAPVSSRATYKTE